MGTNSKIEWCDHTWSPWYCCTRVSEGCANCYMERWAKRCGRDAFGGPIPSKNRMHFPRSKKHKVGDFVFVCSLSDFFHDDAPDQWRADALSVMSQRPELVFLLLTKRIHVAHRFLEEEVKVRIPTAWEVLQAQRNVWLGVTAENQARADERIPTLIELDWPGKKFVSIEPMVGPVDLMKAREGFFFTNYLRDYYDRDGERDWADDPLLDWVIVGGESGANARPMNPAWARAVRNQCKSAGVPFFFKQWGEWAPYREDWPLKIRTRGGAFFADGVWRERGGSTSPIVESMTRYGVRTSGKELDGAEHLERPDSERTR